jgi:hypothetical protein
VKLITAPCTDVLWRAPLIALDAGLRWVLVPMLYNHRLIAYPPGGLAPYGWCFKSPLAALTAATTYDPWTQDEPLGWHKRAGEVRRAPYRDQDPDHNQSRCIHGSYLHEPACSVVEVCPEFRRTYRPERPQGARL